MANNSYCYDPCGGTYLNLKSCGTPNPTIVLEPVTPRRRFKKRTNITTPSTGHSSVISSPKVQVNQPVKVEEKNTAQHTHEEAQRLLVAQQLLQLEQARSVQLEQERLLQLEQERLLQLEQARLLQLEQARLAQLEQGRLLQLEQERLVQLKQEHEKHRELEVRRLAEQQRLAGEERALEEQRLAAIARAEAQVVAAKVAQRIIEEALHAEAQKLAQRLAQEQEQAETQRLAQEQAETQRLAQEQAEAQKLAQEQEQAETQRLAQEQEQVETQKLAQEQAETQRLIQEQLETQRLVQEQLETQRLAQEQAEAQRLAQEQEQKQLETQKLAEEKVEAQRLAEDQAEQAEVATVAIFVEEPSPNVVVWGDNTNKLISSDDVGQVITPQAREISELCAGAIGTGFVVLVEKCGTVKCWGKNNAGQLGLSDYQDRADPTLLSELKHSKITAVAVGDSHVLALTEYGQVFSWGSNNYGQLGYDVQGCSPSPRQILEDKTITQIACGLYHSMALTSSGDVYVWGMNTVFQLGSIGPHNNTPSKMDLKRVRMIAAGDHHCIAVIDQQTIYMWGDNANSQLGISEYQRCVIPTKVTKTPWKAHQTIKQICSTSHTMLLFDDGELYGTGHHRFGQVGESSEGEAEQGVFRLIHTEVSEVGVGLAHTVILTNDGKIKTAGDNSRGQLGHSEGIRSAVFTTINATGSHLIVGADSNIAY